MLYTLDFLQKRHSVRNFSLTPLTEDIKKKLNSEITFINTHEAGFHFCLVTDDSNPFDGFTSSYGFFKNARNYLACVVDKDYPDYQERAGFFAQQLVMKAQTLGLSSCYVGGTYNKNKVNVQLRASWKLLFLVVIGYGNEETPGLMSRLTTRLIHLRKHDAKNFFIGDVSEAEKDFPSLNDMLEAINCSPSSLNKKPVRLKIETIDGEKRLCAGIESTGEMKLVDLGIAKFNMASISDGVWEWGNFSPFYPD